MMAETTLSYSYRAPSTDEEVTLSINPEDLVSYTLPLQPAVMNLQHVRRLTAKDWRHRETNWYDEEHKFLARLSQEKPDYGQLVAEMRLLLYAVFVKEAEVRSSGRKLLTSSRKHFIQEYDSFRQKWGRDPTLPSADMSTNLAQNPGDYLRSVNTWSYFVLRMAVTPLLPGKSPATSS